MKLLKETILLVLIINTSSNIMVEMLGMDYLIQSLVKINPNQVVNGQYSKNNNIYELLSKFKNRTEFCQYKCPSYYQLFCFIIFGCNIHLRNFFLVFIAPIILLCILALCCGKGIWSFNCWINFIGFISGVYFIVWILKGCVDINKVYDKKQELKNGSESVRTIDIKNDQIQP